MKSECAALALLILGITSGCASIEPLGSKPTPQDERLLAHCEPYDIQLAPEITPPKRVEGRPPAGPRVEPREGYACLQVLIDEEGIPREASVDETNSPEFARSILEQLGSWRYEAATLGGKPVAVRISLRFSYRRLR